eukprot:75989_1
MTSRKRKMSEIEEESNHNISEIPKKKKCIRTNNGNEQQNEFQINNNNNNNINNLQEYTAMYFNSHTNTNTTMECTNYDSESDDLEMFVTRRQFDVGPVTNLETLTFSDHVPEFMEVHGNDNEPNEMKSNDNNNNTK